MSVSLLKVEIPVKSHLALKREISSYKANNATLPEQEAHSESDIINGDFICVKILGSPNFISLTDIVMIQADDNYTNIFLVNGKRLLTAKTIKAWHGIIGVNRGFKRLHRSYLVNMQHFLSYQSK